MEAGWGDRLKSGVIHGMKATQVGTSSGVPSGSVVLVWDDSTECTLSTFSDDVKQGVVVDRSRGSHSQGPQHSEGEMGWWEPYEVWRRAVRLGRNKQEAGGQLAGEESCTRWLQLIDRERNVPFWVLGSETVNRRWKKVLYRVRWQTWERQYGDVLNCWFLMLKLVLITVIFLVQRQACWCSCNIQEFPSGAAFGLRTTAAAHSKPGWPADVSSLVRCRFFLIYWYFETLRF